MNNSNLKSKAVPEPSLAKLALSGKWHKIPRHYKGGNDATREKFVAWKRKLIGRELSPRFAALEQAKENTKWSIPRDMGFKVMPPGTFPETDELMKFARDRVKTAVPEEAKTSKSQLLQDLLDKTELTLDSPHVRFGLREEILQAVTTYLGVAPIIEDIDIWRSFFTGDEQWDNSQLWHCDSIDTAQIKIFLYSNDVGPDSGPLTLLSAEASKRVRDAIDYQYVGESRVADEKINELVQPEEIYPITGPAGTCVFVDTSRCFHYGSRVRNGQSERIITLYQYLTPMSFILPLDFKSAAPLKHLGTPQLSQLQRFALGIE